MPSITTSSWLRASWPPPIMPPGNDLVDEPVQPHHEAGLDGHRRPHREQPLTPRAGLQDQIAAGGERAVPGRRSTAPPCWAATGPAPSCPRPEAGAAHADGVDLVDEDDALAAPLAGQPLGLARQQRTVMASMPMNMPAKPEPGIETNGQLKSVAMALDSIVLPVPGAPSISRPRSRLPPARSKASPDCHSVTDATHLLLGLRLAAHVGQPARPSRRRPARRS